MPKKTLKIVILFILILGLTHFGIYLIQNQTLKKSYLFYNGGEGEDYFVRCNLNVFEPEFAKVFFALEQGHISFRRTKMFTQNDQEWESSYTGGATINNATLPKILKMVKKDCKQFQDSYRNPDPNGIEWGYSPVKPEPTEEELAQKRADDIIRMRDEILKMTDKDRQILKNKYGYDENFTDEEIYSWYESNDFSDFEPER